MRVGEQMLVGRSQRSIDDVLKKIIIGRQLTGRLETATL